MSYVFNIFSGTLDIADNSDFLFAVGATGTDFTVDRNGNNVTYHLPFASASATGKLSATDWSTFNNKVGTVTDTNSIDLTKSGSDLFADLKLSATGSDSNTLPVEFFIETDGLRGQVAATSVTSEFSAVDPINYDATSGIISIDQSTTSTDGYLSSTDWNTFNDKLRTLGATGAGVSLIGPNITPTGYIKSVTGGTSISLSDDGAGLVTINNTQVQGITGVTDTNSIDLTSSSNSLSADLRISASAADSGYILGNLTVQTDGLRSQVATSGVTGAISSTFLLKSPGDLDETSATLLNSQAVAVDVTGLLASSARRSASIQYSVFIDATTDLAEEGNLYLTKRAADWTISQRSSGDDSLVHFTVTNAGQVQYTTPTYTGFSSGVMHFRLLTTQV